MSNRPSSKKAQSAMEYLMTYGWAILIIAVVLGALFSLGVFTAPGVQGCVAGPGFYCQTPSYSHATGAITLTIGQSTGTSWTSANIVFVPQGTASVSGVPITVFAQNVVYNGNFYYEGYSGNGITTSGQSQVIVLPVNGITSGANNVATNLATPIAVGSTESGTIWAQYTTAGVSGLQYAQMAAITIKAS
jgi:hypothetical protein